MWFTSNWGPPRSDVDPPFNQPGATMIRPLGRQLEVAQGPHSVQ